MSGPSPQIHETAVVDDGAEIGEGTSIWHWVHVREEASIGEGCTLGQNVYVGTGVEIGDDVSIQNNVSVYQGVTLEDEVFCGPSVVFTNVVHPRSHVSRRDEFEETEVRRGATLGANATILCGIEIGRWAFVAAGAVATRDVEPYSLVVGTPARHAGWVCRCGERLPAPEPTAKCGRCDRSYALDGERLECLES